MPKATKKTTRIVTKKVTSVIPTVVEGSPVPVMTRKPMNSKLLGLLLIIVLIGLLTYKLGPKLVPAVVDNQLVTRFELWSRLEKSYGAQALDDMVNEKILDGAIAKSGVKVDQAKVDDQIKALETQFEATGGLDEALKQRGLSRKDLEDQIRTQLAVEILLADKITPSEADVKAQFEGGATTVYKDKSFDDAKAGIAEELKQAKLRDEFLVWFAEIKKTAKVKNFGL